MCTFAMALGAIGTVTSVGAAMSAANAQKKQAEYQKKVAEQNAVLERDKARHATERGAVSAWNLAEKGRQFSGHQKAALASSGTNMSSGSPFAIQNDTAGKVASDVAIERYNSEMEAWGYNANASQFESEATGYGIAAKNAERTGKINAFSSIIGGASSLAGKWDYWKQNKK